jgi:uncharacterized membrane-anchored protein
MSRHMDRIMRAAVADGLLESAAAQSLTHPEAGERHWSVIVFTALAAWLSAIPLLGVIGLVFFAHSESHGLLVGIPAVVGSVFVLRARGLPLFAEQLAIPCLIAGALSIGVETYDGARSMATTWLTLMLIACAVAPAVPQAWLRTLMGVAIGLLAGASMLDATPVSAQMSPCFAWLLVACGWLLLHMLGRSLAVEAQTARLIAAVEAVSSGVAVACLLGLMWAGRPFLVDAILPAGFGDTDSRSFDAVIVRFLSVMLALGAGGFLAVRARALQTVAYAALLGLCALLAWFTPPLGIALLILFLCVESGRYVLAAFAGVAAAWVIGSLYYDLHWPLAHKALLLGGIGVAIALMGRRTVLEQAAPLAVPERMGKRTRIGFLSCGLLVLAVANAAIWQKEGVIKTGAAVFVELAPADPRSLMEGDYMRLRFGLPDATPGNGGPASGTPQVVARVDSRGIARLLRFKDDQPLARGEFVIDLVRKNNDWTFVTDAWYFREGEAARWSRARYGEFRVAPDGRALLVGLRGADLERL